MLKRAPFLNSMREDDLKLLLYCKKDLLKKEFFLLKNFKNFVYPVLKVQATKKLTTKWLYSEIYSNTELIKH